MTLVFVAGYLAVTRAPAVVEATTVVPLTASVDTTSLWGRLVADPTYTFRSIAALGAIGIVLVGAVPMAAAATSPHADPILAQAVDGTPVAIDKPAPGFNLVDQYGKPVSLASLRGKTVALTFLDDTCTTDCPVIAQEFRTADTAPGLQRPAESRWSPSTPTPASSRRTTWRPLTTKKGSRASPTGGTSPARSPS